MQTKHTNEYIKYTNQNLFYKAKLQKFTHSSIIISSHKGSDNLARKLR